MTDGMVIFMDINKINTSAPVIFIKPSIFISLSGLVKLNRTKEQNNLALGKCFKTLQKKTKLSIFRR